MIWSLIVVVALVFAGFLWYRSYSTKVKNQSGVENSASQDSLKNSIEAGDDEALTEEEIGQLEQEQENFNSTCENGEWVKISDSATGSDTAKGKLRKVYPDDEAAKEFSGYSFFIEGVEKIALAGNSLSKLDFFEDREVEVQGAKSADGKQLNVVQARCAGAEADKDVLDQRRKMMDYVAANINTITPKKAKYKKWVVDEIDIVDDNNIYVLYYDAVEDDENPDVPEDTGRKLLLQIGSKSDGNYDVKQLAYFEMGEDDYDLKQGTNKFSDAETTDYSYDSETNSWERY